MGFIVSSSLVKRPEQHVREQYRNRASIICRGQATEFTEPFLRRFNQVEKPENDWTVESLASEVGMSRSPFAARFSQLVEEPPLRYLTRWRMQKASRLIETSHAGLAVIGKRVGYDAEAAFSKAFKRYTGVSPGAYRRKLERRSRPELRSPIQD